jgi:hypothetical protein
VLGWEINYGVINWEWIMTIHYGVMDSVWIIEIHYGVIDSVWIIEIHYGVINWGTGAKNEYSCIQSPAHKRFTTVEWIEPSVER